MKRLALIAAIALAVAACGSSADDEGTASETADTGSTATTAAASADPSDGDTSDEESAGDEGSPEDAGGDDGQAGATDELFPDVVAATARQDGDGTWTFEATLSSPYDTPDRYADAWRVVGPDGTVFGIRELAHDHANEQPFTRSQSGIEIPDDVTVVTVEGRDQVSGWGGATVEVELP